MTDGVYLDQYIARITCVNMLFKKYIVSRQSYFISWSDRNLSSCIASMEQSETGRGKTLWIFSRWKKFVAMPLTTAKRFQAGVSVNNMTVHWQWLRQCSLKPKNAFKNYFLALHESDETIVVCYNKVSYTYSSMLSACFFGTN